MGIISAKHMMHAHLWSLGHRPGLAGHGLAKALAARHGLLVGGLRRYCRILRTAVLESKALNDQRRLFFA